MSFPKGILTYDLKNCIKIKERSDIKKLKIPEGKRGGRWGLRHASSLGGRIETGKRQGWGRATPAVRAEDNSPHWKGRREMMLPLAPGGFYFLT